MFNGSRAALGVPTRTAYSATKAGMIGMARTWALELAPHGITVNVVAPGPVQHRQFLGHHPERQRARGGARQQRIPVGRLGVCRRCQQRLPVLLRSRQRLSSPDRPFMSAAAPASA
jgi:3-oxoacyl-[acyl-carrier protein] reductase